MVHIGQGCLWVYQSHIMKYFENIGKFHMTMPHFLFSGMTEAGVVPLALLNWCCIRSREVRVTMLPFDTSEIEAWPFVFFLHVHSPRHLSRTWLDQCCEARFSWWAQEWTWSVFLDIPVVEKSSRGIMLTLDDFMQFWKQSKEYIHYQWTLWLLVNWTFLKWIQILSS